MKKQFIFTVFVVFLTIIIFKAWFMPGIIAGGDFDFYLPSMFKNYPIYPYAWSWKMQNGLGGFASPLGWLTFNFAAPLFIGSLMHLSYQTIERVAYFFPFLAMCMISPIYLHKKLSLQNNVFAISIIIFLLNTYILMLAGGGQLTIASAYAFSPIFLGLFISLVNITSQTKKQLFKNKIHYYTYNILLLSFALAVLVLLDIRIAYVLLVAAGIYFLQSIKYNLSKQNVLKGLSNILFTFLVPLTISALIHSFWALPTLLHGSSPVNDLGTAYSSTDAVKYFSFAKLENTISLLHPNWPENIFGKVYFMKAEFLLLPILAYSSLFFVSKNKDSRTKNYILYFALLGLLGAFLAKGANEPFGSLYLWMFEHVPGFNMFRDSTKWYTLIAISYSILIPFSVSKIFLWLKSQTKITIYNLQIPLRPWFKNYIPKLFLILTTLYLLLLIRPAILGQLGGTLKTTHVPKEYIALEQYLQKQTQFFRTMWLPTNQRFGYYSNMHPAISARDYFKKYDTAPLLDELKKSNSISSLSEIGIKYIIVPYDSESEIFLTDRKYDNKKFKNTISQLDTIKQLKKIKTFGNITAYEIKNPKDHFWSPQTNIKISYKYINPVKYDVSIRNARKGEQLIFAESFDKGWILQNSKFKVQSSKFKDKLNSYILPEDGNYNLELKYEPQRWVDIGVFISLISLSAILSGLLYLKLKFKKQN
ncbi:MAG TPA: hypothetical protein VM077_02580 [Candidatus Limnocylindrales bacterium]|nr:hypothetical protein [Candidatus Limnocylindrales bacterium]